MLREECVTCNNKVLHEIYKCKSDKNFEDLIIVHCKICGQLQIKNLINYNFTPDKNRKINSDYVSNEFSKFISIKHKTCDNFLEYHIGP